MAEDDKQPVERLQEGDDFIYGGRRYTAYKITVDADEVRVQIDENRPDLLCLKHQTHLQILRPIPSAGTNFTGVPTANDDGTA